MITVDFYIYRETFTLKRDVKHYVDITEKKESINGNSSTYLLPNFNESSNLIFI